jgi:N-acetylglucosaminyldiphosphoundecaprenol N-acetyl-beta-D-mannosaminyltransferase
MRPVDLSRSVVCIMGLPFDVVDMREAVERVRAAARQRVPCLVSTPNLNFVALARSDESFRDSVIHSQLCLADGMPIVWVSRLLGLPIRRRVSGADLFEALSNSSKPALKVFFFGGAPGVAEAACERVNERPGGGIQCVGFESPGFGSVEDMSGEDRIERINRAGADFVVVSLGAYKGQAWIERNRSRLSAPVISYLGAVVNFTAGTARRAPAALQCLGLEWAWRIKEERGLWRRYARDAAALASMLLRGVLPLYWQRVWTRRCHASPGIELERDGSLATLKLAGVCDGGHVDLLRETFAQAAEAPRIRIDLTLVARMDPTVIGSLLLLKGHQQGPERSLEMIGASAALKRQFRFNGVAFLLDPPAPSG